MFIFYKLILAHLIADFFLQFEELYRFKLRNRLGHLVHVFIHFAAGLLAVLPYLDRPFIWFFIASISLIHFFQDRVKYTLQEKHPRARFPIFVLDQLLHILFLASILLFPISKLKIGFTDFSDLNVFYLEEHWTKLAIIFLLTTLVGSYLLHDFRRTYLPRTSRRDHGITTFEIVHGAFERVWTAAIFATLPFTPFLILYPAVGLLRIPSVKLRSWMDFILSFLYAAGIGLWARQWLR